MGGNSSLIIWGRLVAATGHVVSSVFNVDEFRRDIYGDGFLLSAELCLERRSRTFAVVVQAVAVLGFQLAWDRQSR